MKHGKLTQHILDKAVENIDTNDGTVHVFDELDEQDRAFLLNTPSVLWAIKGTRSYRYYKDHEAEAKRVETIDEMPFWDTLKTGDLITNGRDYIIVTKVASDVLEGLAKYPLEKYNSVSIVRMTRRNQEADIRGWCNHGRYRPVRKTMDLSSLEKSGIARIVNGDTVIFH